MHATLPPPAPTNTTPHTADTTPHTADTPATAPVATLRTGDLLNAGSCACSGTNTCFCSPECDVCGCGNTT